MMILVLIANFLICHLESSQIPALRKAARSPLQSQKSTMMTFPLVHHVPQQVQLHLKM